jgi:hypothetical protein
MEWFANLSNKATRRAYQNTLADFMGSPALPTRRNFGS